jgi:hypothetical protein
VLSLNIYAPAVTRLASAAPATLVAIPAITAKTATATLAPAPATRSKIAIQKSKMMRIILLFFRPHE